MPRVAIIDANDVRRQAIMARVRGAVWCGSPATADTLVLLDPFATALSEITKPALAAGTDFTKSALKTLANAPTLFVANADRYIPARRLIQQQLAAGKLGAPGLVRLHRWESAASEPALLRDLDLVVWYFAKPPNLVFAVQQTQALQVHLGFAGGGMALVSHVYGPFVTPGYSYLTLIGSDGAAYLDDNQNQQILFGGSVPTAIQSNEAAAQSASLVQDFIDGKLERPNWPGVISVADAIDTSLRTHRAVPLEGGR